MENAERLEIVFDAYWNLLSSGDVLTYAVVDSYASRMGVRGHFHELMDMHRMRRPTQKEMEDALRVALIPYKEMVFA